MPSFNVKTIKHQNSFQQRVQPKKSKFGFKIFLAIILVAVFYVLFSFVLPRVDVIIVPVTQDYEKEFDIQLTTNSSKTNFNNNVFLAEVLQSSLSETEVFNATGEKDIGDKAQGKAVFYNSTGRSQPVTPNVDLINDQGIIFIVKENITIPGAKVDENGNIVPGQITVSIESKDPGEKGNVQPGRINISALLIDKQEKIFGDILESMIGGNSKIVKVVSQDDLDNAKDELIKKLEPELKEKISKNALDNFVVSDKLITFDDSEISTQAKVDTEVKKFEVSLNLKANAMVYDNKSLRLFVYDKFLQDLPAGQVIAETEFGYIDSRLEIEVQNIDMNLGLANLKINATFPVAKQIKLDDVRKNILGKHEREARRYILSLENIKDVRFVFSLSLNDKIPTDEKKVDVRLGEIK